MLRRHGSPVPLQLSRRKLRRLRDSARRAGPALPSYLALHHAGFSVPPLLPTERWALTPPFHPCQAVRLREREPKLVEDVSQVYLRAVTVQSRRRSILCGTFRELSQEHRLKPVLPTAPLALPGALPLTLKPSCAAAEFGVRTFLPSRLLGASDHPAHPPRSIIASATPS